MGDDIDVSYVIEYRTAEDRKWRVYSRPSSLLHIILNLKMFVRDKPEYQYRVRAYVSHGLLIDCVSCAEDIPEQLPEPALHPPIVYDEETE